jgi:S-adenosylmethionine:tRNA-ribosyltransferase-isomerase (queuine synthetase)
VGVCSGRDMWAALRDNAWLLPRIADVKKSDFNFDLPPELIAQAPLSERSSSRLLLLDVPVRTWQDRMFRELPTFLRKGDLLVFNDTRVLPARLYGHKPSGGAVEILIERVTGTHEAIVQLGAMPPCLAAKKVFSTCALNRRNRWSGC